MVQPVHIAMMALAGVVAIGVIYFTFSDKKLDPTEIKHHVLESSKLVETGEDNYALTAPGLLPHGWLTVSVNNDNVVAMDSICKTWELKLDEMETNDRNMLIEARKMLLNAEKIGTELMRLFLTQRLSGEKCQSRGMNQIIYSTGDPTIIGVGPEVFSIAQTRFPDGLIRVFVNSPQVAYVYGDKQVEMKPIMCLNMDQRQILHAAQSNFRSVEKIRENKRLEQEAKNLLSEKDHFRRKEEERIKNLFYTYIDNRYTIV